MKNFWGNKKTAIVVVSIWIIVLSVLSTLTPSAKEVTSPSENGGLPETASSVMATKALEDFFPSQKGVPLFVVFKQKVAFEDEKLIELAGVVEARAKQHSAIVMPLSQMESEARKAFVSKDGSIFFMPVLFNEKLESKEIHHAVTTMKASTQEQIDSNISIEWTGPAGIVADTVSLFSQADVVLMLATIGIVFVLLLLIYKSLVFAILPLIGAGIVYGIVDRVIGMLGRTALVTIENQALSIMMILLFAVITDYSLLLFSRYREEVTKGLTVEDAMKISIKNVREPILFSGGTVLGAVLILFTAAYEPYRNFAPVFAVAMVVLLFAGLTLLPALFVLVGRKAFWPINMHKPLKLPIWSKLANSVTSKPFRYIILITFLLSIGLYQVFTIQLSFNLLESFPDHVSSQKGYEQLAQGFSEGEVAPTTMIIESKETLSINQLSKLEAIIEQQENIKDVRKDGNPFANELKKTARLTVILKDNPYEVKAIETLETLTSKESILLEQADIMGSFEFAGETAKHENIKKLNERDTIQTMILITVLIFIMLWWQTKSWITGLLMIATILFSYGASLGFSVWVYEMIFHVESVSYRIPLYTFVFLVALGVDYSIMLMSRIKQEAILSPSIVAIRNGLVSTGGVISSAGLLLAATFAVLMTQPVRELQLFGFTVAFGILVDTFIVRPMLLPALLVIQQRCKKGK